MESTGELTATFIVRLLRTDAGQLSGVVERVRSGVKARFVGEAELCAAIARMVEEETTS